MKQIISFLENLQRNNTTEWFHAHRTEYDEARQRFNDFALKLMAEVSHFDTSTAGLDLKDCTYRINRDIRFSADKSPYKTHFGVFICPGGKKSGKSGYYFQLAPGEGVYPDGCMLAVGNYCFDKKVVDVVREDIDEEGEKFDAMIKVAKEDDFFLDYEGALKRVPRGYDPNHPYADYLRLKAYCLVKPLSLKLVYGDDFNGDDLLTTVVSLFRKNKPFSDYINKVVEFTQE